MKFYYYVFYKLYKFWEYVSIPKFWSDFKATVSMGVLEIWILSSILFYYSYITDTKLKLDENKPLIIIFGILIFGLNYFSFIHTNKWKEYNAEFDKLPRRKNIIGGIIVWIIIILIIVNVFSSGFLMQKNVLGM